MSKLSPKPKLSLSLRHRSLLEGYLDKRTRSLHYQQRIQVVLYSHEGLSIAKISEKLSVSTRTSSKWRICWRDNYEKLCAYEQKESPSDTALLSQMLGILSDAPRSGAPPRISMSEKENLVALACKEPLDFGIPFSNWNRELLAEVAMSKGLVKQISPSYAGKILKK